MDRTPYAMAMFSAQGQGDVMRSAQRVLSDAEAVAGKRQPGIDVDCELLQGGDAATRRRCGARPATPPRS
ncbi:hypothetical protein [Spongiactinospora sp. 9N601]|uniref:hypothetical protein n=1 Tax=Spongiactinospora sp. 9N601 TaxID=3375149 RepID=UPI00379DDC2B